MLTHHATYNSPLFACPAPFCFFQSRCHPSVAHYSTSLELSCCFANDFKCFELRLICDASPAAAAHLSGTCDLTSALSRAACSHQRSMTLVVSSGSTGGWGMHTPSDKENFFAAEIQERRFSMITKYTAL
jgi:hypothetical protein